MDTSKPVALIDLSSYVFYRYYAIQRWLQMNGKEMTPDEVLAKFETLFETNLKIMKRKLKVDWENVVLAVDCPREMIWRMALHPAYKGNRDTAGPDKFDGRTFERTFDKIIPDMRKQGCNFQVVRFDTAEADDIIAVLHNEIRRRQPETKVHIVTLDTDFLQLASNHTDVINFQLKPITSRFTADKMSHYLLWKIIRGDAADNIPAIDKKIGDATALKLAMNPDMLKARLAAPEVKASFERNTILISFDSIPEVIKTGIIALMQLAA